MSDQACSVQNATPVNTEVDLTAMEYTDVLSIEQLYDDIVQKHTEEDPQIMPWPMAEVGDEKLVIPTTEDGKIIIFSLSASNLHEISDQYVPVIRVPHETSQATTVPIHVCIDEDTAKVMRAFDVHLKGAYRNLMPHNHCQAWAPLVKTTNSGGKVITMEIVLDNSDAPTQILILKPGGTVVEGEGSEFLLNQIGSIENLKNYMCNPIAEFSWILYLEAEGYHRLRVKLHSIFLRKKPGQEPALKRFKIAGQKLETLMEKNRLIQLASAF